MLRVACDVWTNNFGYVGGHATGNGAGTYLLTSPDSTGPIPDGVTRINPQTTIASIVGWWAFDGPTDLPAIAALSPATRTR